MRADATDPEAVAAAMAGQEVVYYLVHSLTRKDFAALDRSAARVVAECGVRGWIDRLVGGVGLRRGRRHPHRLRVGEALDWWRVERLDRGRLLRLRAEMRLPGRAWLELSVRPDGDGGAVYRQRALFLPQGSPGHLYWLALRPLHGAVFGGMARNLVGAAGHTNR